MAGASRYELMLAKLAADRRTLKGIQSIARKIEVKKRLLPEYLEYVAGVLESGRGAQDDVIVTVMIWMIDAGGYDDALMIARYALKHGLALPEQFERTLASAVVEQYADAALAALAEGETFDAALLANVAELTEGADMHDQVRAKLYKSLGYAFTESEPQAKLHYLRKALSLNDRVGVKRDIERLEKQIKNDAAGEGSGDSE